jgi:hypothetical protein
VQRKIGTVTVTGSEDVAMSTAFRKSQSSDSLVQHPGGPQKTNTYDVPGVASLGTRNEPDTPALTS